MDEIILLFAMNGSHFSLTSDTICVTISDVLEAGDDLVTLAIELCPFWLLTGHII